MELLKGVKDMLKFLKGKKTYFVNYTIYWSKGEHSLNHSSVSVKRRRSDDLVLDVVKHLAKKHDCLENQIILNTLNEI